MLKFVWRDLVRNPRRTLASLSGVILGVGLFSGVLFFVDGSGATMTERALAPLSLDIQRVIGSPLGPGLRLRERATIETGATARITLTVTNEGSSALHDVTVRDEPPAPLVYVRGSTRVNGTPRPDADGSPLAHGPGRTGLNLGHLRPGTTVMVTYAARAGRAVDPSALRFQGTTSSREHAVPVPANAPPRPTLEELRAMIGRTPGVAAADSLRFVDLAPGSLRAAGRVAPEPVRVFAFDQEYSANHSSIRIVEGGFSADSALLSPEAARALGAGRGPAVETVETIELSLPGWSGRPVVLALPVGGVADLSRATPLYSSRNSKKLEDFLYIPNAVVVAPETFERVIVPAFAEGAAAGGGVIRNLPRAEVDVLLDRSLLHSDPGRALEQTRAIAGRIGSIAPGEDYLIDSVSNTLEVARDDAVVGKRMFVFLGLPGVVLAAILAWYAGTILAATQRREQATLRTRGAHRGHLLRMLLYRSVLFAGVGAILGTALGFLSVVAILGRRSLMQAAGGDLVASGLFGAGLGILVTGLALFVSGQRSLRHQIDEERRELTAARTPTWRRWGLDVALLGAAALAEILAVRSGAFDAPSGSVYSGRAVVLPTRLLVAPLIAWVGGVLLTIRLCLLAARRRGSPPGPRFGSAVGGTLARSLRRRAGELATGILVVGLVVAFGASLAMFSATYDSAKAADARFLVGADLRITPSALSPRPHPAAFAADLKVEGVSAVTPVVFRLESAVVLGVDTQDVKALAAIDPEGFHRVAALSDSVFPGGSAAAALAALRAHPDGVLVQTRTAQDLSLSPGDPIRVVLARGTKHQTQTTLRMAGAFDRFPGFPAGVDLVANLGFYASTVGTGGVDFFLADAANGTQAGVARSAGALRSGPGRQDPLLVETPANALDKDQSSLTALNIHGLLNLDSLFTLAMSAAAVAIFVLGLMLQRRREYVTLRAQGMQAGELRLLVLGEAGVVGLAGLAAGIAVGAVMAALLVHVLRPLFVLDPRVTVSMGGLGVLAALTAGATVLSAVLAAGILNRLRPTELLRES